MAKNIHFCIHVTPIIQVAIDSLLHKSQVVPDDTSRWLAKPLLASKHHQGDITSNQIDDLAWRFCINYIPLNFITKVAPYPIPRCHHTIQIKVSKALFRILLNTFSGYHQIKTAFVVPGGRKYRYIVMPIGIKMTLV